ncbi:MAG: siroheme synthase [Rhodanobacteraceae bacterium]|jgi:uroporphyrin-III C-methyltransferase/precorrin-2 dehydrogenase/sirohydrochlorin ferrochelatase|nr:MAG: siroheme synthase [Rhodanobacteraceae bacterium]
MDMQPSSGPTAAPLFPLFADLRGRAVLVAGGGAVARRKIESLLEAGAAVTVNAASLEPELREWSDAGRVRWLRGAFQPAWLDGMWLVVAASGDATLDRRVAEAAHARRILVNVVDDAEASSFHVPARVRRGRLQVAISSGGAAPVLARRLRERLETELDESLGALTGLFTRERARIRRRFPQAEERRRFFQSLLDGDVPRLLRTRADAAAQAAFDAALANGASSPRRGSVALVGAGPGDPGLLTLKALRALQEADVILHDRLIGPAILDLARRDAERIDVGKCVGKDHDATQARIHALMLQHARSGRRVVRLQGGDPLLFGRGAEELDFLRAHGIPHEIIPGITAAVASAAAAGIPLTDRRHARSVTLLSPRGGTTLDIAALAAPGQTLAVYMGVGELEALSRVLIANGRSAGTPCVLVENASLPEQRVLRSTLEALPALARAHDVRAPALLIIGEVAAQAPSATHHERCCGITPVARAA